MYIYKYHALGNDYLVLNTYEGLNSNPINTYKICHRHSYIGSDGILYGPLSSNKADFSVRILNSDGSVANKSGNGLRIFTKYLFDLGYIKPYDTITIDTIGGIVRSKIYKNIVYINIGCINFIKKIISLPNIFVDIIRINKIIYRYYAVSIGNNHIVLPIDNISLVKIIGNKIESNINAFPDSSNVQFLKVINRYSICIEIWERGSGYTISSGTSCAAAASVAYKMGLVNKSLLVLCKGGNIKINIDSQYLVTLIGTVSKIGMFKLT